MTTSAASRQPVWRDAQPGSGLREGGHGLLEWPLDSTGFMRWGGGAGSWVRIYANREHVFAVIAGLRLDTFYSEDGDRSGPG